MNNKYNTIEKCISYCMYRLKAFLLFTFNCTLIFIYKHKLMLVSLRKIKTAYVNVYVLESNILKKYK